MRGENEQSNKTYTETIERTEFSDEMNQSYVDYAMSVTSIGRACLMHGCTEAGAT